MRDNFDDEKKGTFLLFKTRGQQTKEKCDNLDDNIRDQMEKEDNKRKKYKRTNGKRRKKKKKRKA